MAITRKYGFFSSWDIWHVPLFIASTHYIRDSLSPMASHIVYMCQSWCLASVYTMHILFLSLPHDLWHLSKIIVWYPKAFPMLYQMNCIYFYCTIVVIHMRWPEIHLNPAYEFPWDYVYFRQCKMLCNIHYNIVSSIQCNLFLVISQEIDSFVAEHNSQLLDCSSDALPLL